MTQRRPAGVLLLAVLAGACAGEAQGGGGGAASTAVVRGRVLVSAAASLTDAFAAVDSAFEAAHPGTEIVLNPGGSSALRTQILEGAPVDVFASANRANMDEVARAGEVAGEPRIFARNRLRIVVPPGNPANIHSLRDFERAAPRLGLCARGVPCGDFAREALARAGVTPAIDTEEPDVRALLTKVELGELDGGITYLTDVASAGGKVRGIDIPGDQNVVAEYTIAVLAGASNPRGAEAYVLFVLSDVGQRILGSYGFAPP